MNSTRDHILDAIAQSIAKDMDNRVFNTLRQWGKSLTGKDKVLKVSIRDIKSKHIFKVKATGAFYGKVVENPILSQSKYIWRVLNFDQFDTMNKPAVYIRKQQMQHMKKQKKLVKATRTEIAALRVLGHI